MSAERQARIARILEAYDAQGWHRTGTAVDTASAAWFVEVVKETGGGASLEEFALERFDPLVAEIETAGQRIAGLPLFDAPPAPGGSVRGALGPVGSRSPIGLVVTNSPAPDRDYDELRWDSGHEALVAVTKGPEPGLQARNAGSFRTPFGVPVLQVASEHEAFLRNAAESGAEATLSISAVRTPAESSNVVACVPGTNPALAPMVISTPRTGWWNCSGERGGGIACWFELLRSAVEKPHPREMIFVAFAGHELGHLGLDAFLNRRPGIAAAAHAWVHFGANVGAAYGPAVRLSASTEADLAAARAALEAEQVGQVTSPAAGVVNGGESSVVAALGARCVALLGGNDRFHLESDRWPGANDVGQIARQAQAFEGLVRGLAGELP